MEWKWTMIAICAIAFSLAIGVAADRYAEGMAGAEAAKAGLVQKYINHNTVIWVKPDN